MLKSLTGISRVPGTQFLTWKESLGIRWFCRIKQLKESFAAGAGLESDYLAQSVLELWIADGHGRGAAGAIEVQGASSPGGDSLVGESWIASP